MAPDQSLSRDGTVQSDMQVYEGPTGGYFDGSDATDVPTTQSFNTTANNLTPGTVYDFCLETYVEGPFTNGVAYGGSKIPYLSALVISTTGQAPPGPAPLAPDHISATWLDHDNTQNNHHAFIYWHDNAPDEQGVYFERSTDPSFPTGSQTVLNLLPADASKFEDDEPDYDHKYYYRVASVKNGVQSAWSLTAELDPGVIIAGFYGADTIFDFPNGDAGENGRR